MKVHTTNYHDTFIETAPDSKAVKGEIPPVKESARTAATIQFGMVYETPYLYTSDDVLFHVFAEKNSVAITQLAQAREQFFSKGQACFRASPLTKRYGWGVHSDKNGKIALYGCETDAYKTFVANPEIKKVKAMKSGK
jgi:hypothetical protein